MKSLSTRYRRRRRARHLLRAGQPGSRTHRHHRHLRQRARGTGRTQRARRHRPARPPGSQGLPRPVALQHHRPLRSAARLRVHPRRQRHRRRGHPDSNRSVETELAVDFIIDAVKTYGKDLIYVPTGPMTNIEAALKKAPEIKDEIGQIVLMGGAGRPQPGNCKRRCMEAQHLAGSGSRRLPVPLRHPDHHDRPRR